MIAADEAAIRAAGKRNSEEGRIVISHAVFHRSTPMQH